MLNDLYFTKKYTSDKYNWYGAVVVTSPSYIGAYAIIVSYRPNDPVAVFDALRGITVDLNKTAIAEDADLGVIERIGKTSVISDSRPTSTIERIQ